MKNKKTIAIVGHFGGQENFLDGQTVKTKILYDELQSVTNWKIKKVDTYYKKNNPVKLLWQTFVSLFTTKDIIILLSGNGMKFYFPLLYFWSKIFHTRIYHDVIGGNLSDYVAKFPKYKKYLNSFKVNWVETYNMKVKLENLGVENAEVLPNFKRLKRVDINDVKVGVTPPYRFCTFSRVMKEKGVEDAIFAIECINEKSGRELCLLDIYGKIDDGYSKRFETVMKNVSASVKYKGIVPFDKSVESIKDYYALLFPTFWDGEGFPGTIIDAFSAGVPVIATDWNANAEIIQNLKNGIIYPNCEHTNLYSAVLWAVENPNSIQKMKFECIKSAEKYRPEKYIDLIVDTVNKNFY